VLFSRIASPVTQRPLGGRPARRSSRCTILVAVRLLSFAVGGVPVMFVVADMLMPQMVCLCKQAAQQSMHWTRLCRRPPSLILASILSPLMWLVLSRASNTAVGRTPRSKNVAKFISITKNAEVIYLQETGHRVYFQKGAWLHSENCKQCAAQPALARRRKARVGSGKSKSLGALRG
jgi:hypothetical protein